MAHDLTTRSPREAPPDPRAPREAPPDPRAPREAPPLPRAAVSASVRVTAPSWPAAVRAAGQGLVGQGCAEQRYVERCVAQVRADGPYIVVAPGIALAHARPEDGARALGVSVAVLDRPVKFGHPVNDPVDVVFAFCSPDRDAHVGLLSALARQLAAGLADRLRSAPDHTTAASLLSEVTADG